MVRVKGIAETQGKWNRVVARIAPKISRGVFNAANTTAPRQQLFFLTSGLTNSQHQMHVLDAL